MFESTLADIITIHVYFTKKIFVKDCYKTRNNTFSGDTGTQRKGD